MRRRPHPIGPRRRPPPSEPASPWWRLAFVLYVGVVAFGVFGPNPGDEVNRVGDGLRQVEDEVRSAVPRGSAPSPETPVGRRDGDWLFGELTAEDVGNIAMFVPFGALFPFLWPRWRWWTIPAGVAISALVELVQLLFLSWRDPSVSDVRWNGLGATVGFALWLAGFSWWRLRLRRRQSASSRSG